MRRLAILAGLLAMAAAPAAASPVNQDVRFTASDGVTHGSLR